MVLEAIRLRDYPLLEGSAVLFTTIIVLSNVIVDIAYGWFDPRIRYS
jgi:ABC-type dipeptide/oligopeptide/nickel transport system permease component